MLLSRVVTPTYMCEICGDMWESHLHPEINECCGQPMSRVRVTTSVEVIDDELDSAAEALAKCTGSVEVSYTDTGKPNRVGRFPN